MSDRVCYLARRDQGARIESARLVGSLTEERWEAPAHRGSDNGAADPVEVARDAARWVAGHLAARDGQRPRLRVVCLDTDGAACGWLTAPSAEESVVAAAAATRVDSDSSSGLNDPWASPGESTVQALAEGGASRPAAGGTAVAEGERRLAVLAVPDAGARVFLDALDDAGVSASSVVSLWHAAATAWDPAGPASPGPSLRGDRVVATTAPVTAVVLVDPAGRLVWSWSRAGELVAGGSIRLPSRDEDPAVTGADVGRLATDWLGWSAQLGVAPARIVVVTPRLVEDGDSLSSAGLGEGLGRAWPGATVDLATHDDPLGATLRRLAEFGAAGPAADPRASLVRLTHRPGRAHRSLYRAAALAILGAAAGLAAVGVRAWSAAGTIRGQRETIRAATLTRMAEVLPDVAASPYPDKDLDDELARLKAVSAAGREIQPAKPILAELDAISAVLTKDTKPYKISLADSSVSLGVVVPITNLAAGQELIDSLRSVGGSHCDWRESGDTQAQGADKLLVYFYGAWRTSAEGNP